MIERTQSYKVGDKFYASLQEAQEAEIAAVFLSEEPQWKDDNFIATLAKHLVKHAPKVIDILSTKANSRPKARKSNGATRKPRNSKPAMPTAPETNTTHL